MNEQPLMRGHSQGPALSTEVHDGVAIITFDLPGDSVNKFNRRVKNEFIALFDRLERDSSIGAAVLLSGKSDVWVAGADIDEFLELRSGVEAEMMSRDGQALLEKLENLRVPVIAAIHGACMGGGVEAALACAYRIITDHPRSIMALPEVQLGLIPGAGGTQRLPKLIGLREALDMILTGRSVRPAKALSMRLVDEMVHPAILRDVAIRRAHEFASGARARIRKRRAAGIAGALLDGTAAGRSFVLKKAREKMDRNTGGNYPAPAAALQSVEAGYSPGGADGFRTEARLFGEMWATDVSRQLIYLYYASGELKKDPGVESPAPEPLQVSSIGVLGAGFMGAGISALAAHRGIPVRMKDAARDRLARGLALIRPVAAERLRRKQITRQQFEDEMSLVTVTTDYSGFGQVDLVIEAVFEDLKVKQQVVREVERALPERAIVATNTSTIPIAEIATSSSRPERLLGMHFFSPVDRMPLLEVITTSMSDREVVVTAVAVGKSLGKTVIVVNDGPGFYVNRILSPYLNEAGLLIDNGARIGDVDAAMEKFGFKVGPLKLMDEVGLDVAAKGGEVMAAAFGARMAPPRSFVAIVAAGRHGRKNRSGFYTYDSDGKAGSVDESVYDHSPTGRQRIGVPSDEIQGRLVAAMLNEAVRCLEEGVIRSARDGNVGAVYGIGFPPFRGGPFRYIDSMGLPDLVRQLEELNERFPGRFEPADMLVHMSRRGLRFHDG